MRSRTSLAILFSSILSLTSAQILGYLSNYHSDCTTDSRSLSSACMAAMHRLCVDQNLGTAAYPQEFGTNTIAFLCITTPYNYDIQYWALPGCAATPFEGSQSTLCYSRADGFCAAVHPGTSGIPQEFGINTIGLPCVAAQYHQNVAMAELETYHPGCSSPAYAQQGACMAASHRYCAALGNGALGGLIVELGPASVTVACVENAKMVIAGVKP